MQDVNEVDQILSDRLVGLAICYAFHCLTLLVTHRCWLVSYVLHSGVNDFMSCGSIYHN